MSLRTAALAGVAALTLTGCGSSRQALPKNRLIVPGRSIGPISLDELRSAVTRSLGPGERVRGTLVSYFGGRLLITYWFHDRLTHRVSYLETTWDGFHTRSGVRVGTSRGDLPVPRSSCLGGTCAIPLHDGPDAPGTGFRIRRDRVVRIAVGYG
jgi:hypothetical protein